MILYTNIELSEIELEIFQMPESKEKTRLATLVWMARYQNELAYTGLQEQVRELQSEVEGFRNQNEDLEEQIVELEDKLQS